MLLLFSNNDINFIDMKENPTITVSEVGPLGQSCKYNPLKDTAKVVPGLATDINDMLRTGIVKDGEISLDNNGIDDPDHIIGRCADQFDALEAARAIKTYCTTRKKAKSELAKVVEKAVEGAAGGAGSSNGGSDAS